MKDQGREMQVYCYNIMLFWLERGLFSSKGNARLLQQKCSLHLAWHVVLEQCYFWSDILVELQHIWNALVLDYLV